MFEIEQCKNPLQYIISAPQLDILHIKLCGTITANRLKMKKK